MSMCSLKKFMKLLFSLSVHFGIRRMDLESSGHIESLWLEITFNKSVSILLCTVYICHEILMPWHGWTFLKLNWKMPILIVMGDFNVDLLSQEENFVYWLEAMNLFNLKQIIEEPTRITPCTASLINHIYVSNPEKVRAVKVSKILISDHFPTSFVHKATFGNKQCHFVIKFRSFKNFDEPLFLNDLNSVPWSILHTYADPSNALDVANLHAPFRKKQPN